MEAEAPAEVKDAEVTTDATVFADLGIFKEVETNTDDLRGK